MEKGRRRSGCERWPSGWALGGLGLGASEPLAVAPRRRVGVRRPLGGATSRGGGRTSGRRRAPASRGGGSASAGV